MVARARPSTRLLFMLACFILGLAVISARLVYVQGLNSDRFVAMAADQRQRKIELRPQRGSVYDRNGTELAISLDMKTIFANPRFVGDARAYASAMAPLLGLDAGAIESKLKSKKGFVYLARQVDPQVADKVKALKLPGIDMVSDSKRFYPSDALAAHVVGFVGSDNLGLAGLEGRYNNLLAGTPGEMLMESDPQGRAIPAGNSSYKAPRAGDDLILTIDREIQFAAEASLLKAVQTFSAKGGTIIVMKPQTGEILAMANAPTFDPNNVKASTPEQRRNRALIDVYEPGSANKVITASAAIESGAVAPKDVISVPDTFRLGSKTFHDAHPHATEDLTFAQVIQQSSNIGTIKVAQKLGKDRLYDYLVRFGYGKPTGLDFPGESSGILPKVKDWWDTSMGTIPIGQGVAVTGMQIMSVFSTIANG
ncbi:MAG: peptidoglycan D,D-transpeptidase FtsI family protein, partial [Actinomycetota bacterium]